ncbi:MAG: alpha/beta hydrolase [Clostridiales bacterium]|nr:alpha/beta hydrolase [Clostridiales bacterium]
MIINIDGINTNYIKQGGGEACLLLHGWGANIKLFERLINLLSKKYCVYALDMPGFGETDEPKNTWCVDDYVDFVLKFAEKMNITSANLLGHSFGGRVIIKMVTRESTGLEPLKITLIDSAGIKPKKSLKQKLSLRAYKISRAVMQTPPLKKMFPDAVENMRKKRGSADYNSASPVMRSTLVKVVNEDLTPLLKNIKQSTLLIWGDKDTATPIDDARLMEKLIPDSGLVVVKGSGHYSFLEQPVFVEKVIASFMNLEVSG